MPDRKTDIIKYVSFTVDHSKENNYGDLVVTSKSGKEYKIGNKRANLFNIFQPDAEVVVGYASYMNKDYIAVAHPIGEFPANITVEKETPTQQKPTPPPPPTKIEPPKATEYEPAPQERGMWFKELGECIRSKDIDVTTATGKLMRAFYYAEMLKVLNIKIEKES